MLGQHYQTIPTITPVKDTISDTYNATITFQSIYLACAEDILPRHCLLGHYEQSVLTFNVITNKYFTHDLSTH